MNNVPSSYIDAILSGPSARKTTQVAQLQNDVQDWLAGTHHTFLQGSYKNDTAPSDINDVDIVAVRQVTYSGIHSNKRFPQQIAWDMIFQELEEKLRGHDGYNWTVERGDKCIKLSGPFNVDVVPAIIIDTHDEDPIVIYSMRGNTEIKNHPRTHYDNGVIKNAATNGTYKPTVRMFKNWKQNHYGQDKSTVSSFKIEALVHAVPDAKFVEDPVLRFFTVGEAILGMLSTRALVPIRVMSVCGNEDIMAHWDLAARQRFATQLATSLNLVRQAYAATRAADAGMYWKQAFNLPV